MAGHSRLYVLGGPGGFLGADGVGAIEAMIVQGDGSRQWLEPRYIDEPGRPLGSIRRIVPEGPGHPDALIDACIAFCPHYFRSCPSLAAVEAALGREDMLDFHAAPKKIPAAWSQLREEARPIFAELGIWRADLVPMERGK